MDTGNFLAFTGRRLTTPLRICALMSQEIDKKTCCAIKPLAVPRPLFYLVYEDTSVCSLVLLPHRLDKADIVKSFLEARYDAQASGRFADMLPTHPLGEIKQARLILEFGSRRVPLVRGMEQKLVVCWWRANLLPQLSSRLLHDGR